MGDRGYICWCLYSQQDEDLVCFRDIRWGTGVIYVGVYTQQDGDLVCFRDIVPAAPHHYLVVPRKHIDCCWSLTHRHASLVERMADMGRAALRDQGITDMEDIRLGFHQPPYTSVNHLHLHVLAPASRIYDCMAPRFIPHSYRFLGVHCLFCCITTTKDTDTEIISRDQDLVCLRDAKPGARHHFLVVPTSHMGNCTSLHREHIPIVEQMKEMGRSVLEKHNVSDLQDVRMGFHLPPFSSVPHLHLHVLAPASEMNSRSLSRYGPQSYWFITVDNVLHQLNTHGKVK
ncbi:Histidine triad nucleotide-binding protein 3 [Merluccius polli]|uniref:Histidine triad nucleotide-binding protein 3 n=1 Tax=Merluccius polli TaxID=89951 RepID=A0AA47NLG2_MERPO|nr:Histidine triad nucleotide-binding protein 3 [Merluccius polli]